MVLARVLGDETLDFCLLISSNAAILGGLGFSAYAASNLFMDAFATAHARTTGQRWISANWDGWPTEEISTGVAHFETSIDRFAMTLAECEQAFERVLVQPSPHVVVSSADLGTRLQLWTTRPGGPSHRPVVRAEPRAPMPDESAPADGRHRADEAVSALHVRPNLSNDYRAPVTLTEKRLCRIWQELFAIDALGVDDNFFELRGDSLLATQLIAIASKEFKMPIPIRRIFEHASVARLSKLIDETAEAATLVSRAPADRVSADEEEGSI
jgi:hypothetical protein